MDCLLLLIQKYFTDNFVFCNPQFDLKNIDINSKRIIFINKGKDDNDNEKFIPCFFIQEYEKRSKFLIYFHGNREDIFDSEMFGQYLSEYLKMNVIIIEYPGYSIYDEEKNADIICKDAEIVYDFIQKKFNLNEKDIYVLGRSLGTGPAVYLASQKSINSLFLISPFTSIRAIYKIFSKLLLDIFKTIDIIKDIKCPIQIIHGEKDNIINVKHSEELMNILESINPNNLKEAKYPPNMTHNKMDIEKDIFNEINNFISKNKLYDEYKTNNFSLKDQKFKGLFDIPISIQNFLMKKNFQLDEPVIIKKIGRCSLLLNDERVCFGTDDSKILIYDIDEDETQIIIDTKEIGQINSLIQLKNNILIGYNYFKIGLYSLKRFKSTKLKSLNIYSKIIKVEEGDNNKIFVFTENNWIIYEICNDQLIFLEIPNECKEMNSSECNINFKFVSPYIYAISSSKISKLNYEENKKEFQFINQDKFNIIENKQNIINIIQLDETKIGILCQKSCLFINLNDFSVNSLNHNFENPDKIYKLTENIIIIKSKENKYKIFYINLKEKITEKYKNLKEFYIPYNITSFIGLKNGRIFTTKSKTDEKSESRQDYCSIY